MSARTTEANRRRALGASLMKRASLWREADARSRRLAHGQSDEDADATRLADDYRMLAHDLARARRLLPETRAREYLEAAYARAHAALHRGAWHPGAALLALFRDEIPEVVRWLAPYLVWTTLVFVLAAAAGYALIARYPELIALFASPDMIANVERGQLWTHDILNIVPSSVLSVQLLANNIVVSLFAYCAGFLFGLGTLYIIGLNGLMLGAAFAFVAQHGLSGPLFEFIVAHGCVELSVICVSGAAGAAVGEALIRPAYPTRIEAFRVAALRSGKVLAACALLLAGSGLIEGFISPDPAFPLWSRVVIGLCYWALMLALLTGRLFRRPRAADQPAPDNR
jgi:uncharacterized membrane protein SpoIIM required for sporulation